LGTRDAESTVHMSKEHEQTEHDELDETELDEYDGEPLPDREAMSVIEGPFTQSPGIMLPVEPTE
jgi:hypothetical protein